MDVTATGPTEWVRMPRKRTRDDRRRTRYADETWPTVTASCPRCDNTHRVTIMGANPNSLFPPTTEHQCPDCGHDSTSKPNPTDTQRPGETRDGS